MLSTMRVQIKQTLTSYDCIIALIDKNLSKSSSVVFQILSPCRSWKYMYKTVWWNGQGFQKVISERVNNSFFFLRTLWTEFKSMYKSIRWRYNKNVSVRTILKANPAHGKWTKWILYFSCLEISSRESIPGRG